MFNGKVGHVKKEREEDKKEERLRRQGVSETRR